MKVRDVMHKGLTCVESDAHVQDIAKRMRDDDIGLVAVKADGHLIGVITDRDVTCRVLADGAAVNKITAKEIMTKDVVCCSPEDDVALAIEVMEKKKIRRLPVTDSHKIAVGMLSLGDISHKVGNELSGDVLRAVSAHHG